MWNNVRILANYWNISWAVEEKVIPVWCGDLDHRWLLVMASSPPFGCDSKLSIWLCLCRHVCVNICCIPNRRTHKKLNEFVVHISWQKRSPLFHSIPTVDVPLANIPSFSSLPPLTCWCVRCCHLSTGNSVKIHAPTCEIHTPDSPV